MMEARLINIEIKEKIVNFMLEQASKNGLTISNIRSISDEVISYLEKNAILEMKIDGLNNDKPSISGEA